MESSPSPDIRPEGETSEDWESESNDAAGASPESGSQVQPLRDIRLYIWTKQKVNLRVAGARRMEEVLVMRDAAAY